MRSYNKVYGKLSVHFRQLTITKDEQKDYGFITKYDVRLLNQSFPYGEVIQKYTGEVIRHPGGTGREKVWLYTWHLEHRILDGKAQTLTECLSRLEAEMEKQIVQT